MRALVDPSLKEFALQLKTARCKAEAISDPSDSVSSPSPRPTSSKTPTGPSSAAVPTGMQRKVASSAKRWRLMSPPKPNMLLHVDVILSPTTAIIVCGLSLKG